MEENFENILRRIINFEIKSYKISYLTEPGENYGSIMLKINIEGVEDGEVKNIVAKLCPSNEVIRKAFLTDVTFKKEIYAYEKAGVAIKEFQHAHNMFNDYFPECYGTNLSVSNGSIGNDSMIILENLSDEGYGTVDRMVGFDLNYATIILRKLAHLHASVIALRVLKGEVFETAIRPALVPTNVGSTMLEGFCNTALHFAKSIHELEPYMDKIENIIEEGKKIGGLQFPKETNKNLYTMIHTDLWTNNLMVKEDEDKNVKVKIIDLQLLEFGSLVRDVLFFLFTSTQTNIIDKYLEYLLNSYYYNFQQYLCNYSIDFINNPNYSREVFYKEINFVAPHELFHIIFMLKPIFSEKGSLVNLDNISKEDFARKDNIGQTYINRLRFIILTFAKNNWI